MKTIMLPVMLLALQKSVSNAASMDWVGKYTDALYGEGLSVCVDTISSDRYIGQGLLSSLGYMRGEIVGDVWAGEYWLAGFEARMGTFRLALSAGGDEYSGYFTEKPGQNITASGSRTNASMPEDLECYRTDAEYLEDGVSFAFHGHFTQASDPYDNWWLTNDGSTVTSTYTYTENAIPGTTYGPMFLNGQVSVSNWFEPGKDEGIYLLVARNETSFYNLWWYFPRVSDVDISQKPNGYFGTNINLLSPGVQDSEVARMAESGNCYVLWTDDMESDCLERSGDSSSSEDHEVITDLLIAILLCTVVGIGLMSVALYLLMRDKSLSSQQSSSSEKL